MAVLRRPILVGGVGLTFGLWALQSFQHTLAEVSTFATLGAIAAGASWWLIRQQTSQFVPSPQPETPVSRATVEAALAETQERLTQLHHEAAELPTTTATTQSQIATLQQQLHNLHTASDRTQLRLQILGGQGVGKTTLVQTLQTEWLPKLSTAIELQDTMSLFAAQADQADAERLTAAQQADLVIFVTAGDLTETELRAIQKLTGNSQRVLLVLNKQDQYLPTERSLVLQQLQNRTQSLLKSQDIVAIAAAPNLVKVRQHQADGSVQEWLEQPQADLQALTTRLQQIASQESESLILATVWRDINTLKAEVQTVLNQVRRDRALPLVEQCQWIAAATAFANPVPTLDLLATTAINAQLVLDLSTLYQQKFSLPQAQTVAKTMASLLIQLGLVELSTQAIGSALKTNAVTFVAGGLLQGASAAYLTRIAGLTLIEYFQDQSAVVQPTAISPLNIERLGQILKTVFQQNQRTVVLQNLVQQVSDRLTSSPTPLQLTAAIEPPLQLPLPELERVEENRTAVSLSSSNLESSSVLSP